LIEVIGDLSAWFALINILPIPPLTGVHLLAVAVPVYAKIAPYAGPMLAAVAATGVFTNVLGSAYGMLAHSLLNK
jgi:Zn-dependent protease